ncbi:hypothetical protein ACFQ1M_13160 [Sungkyunkwania multivorans]|uniref:Polysaccharide chain length determinant N-terminal domain-containing protein n=1 Tax=Sungkyunkwania multivorans TaxID=1173618 RepID=A0ABW3CZA3_9FLAO
MSEQQKNLPQKQSEEIDLVQLFAMIGNGFEKLFKAIGKVLEWILDVFLRFLLVIRRHFLKFVIVGIIFAAIGYYLDTRERIFTSSAFVAPNYSSTVQLFSNVETLDRMVQQGDVEGLKNLLKLDSTQAANLKSFEIEKGPATENDNLMAYDRFIKEADSITIGLVSFEQYIDQMNKYSASQFEIRVRSKDPNLFSQIQGPLLDIIGKNPFILKKQQVELDNIDEKIKDVEVALDKLDSLRAVYLDVLSAEAKRAANAAPGAGTNISFAEKSVKTNELQLFNLEKEYRDQLKELNTERIEKENIVELVSGFQTIGESRIPLHKRNMILLPLIAEGLLIMILLSFSLNRFLVRYEENIKRTEPTI